MGNGHACLTTQGQEEEVAFAEAREHYMRCAAVSPEKLSEAKLTRAMREEDLSAVREAFEELRAPGSDSNRLKEVEGHLGPYLEAQLEQALVASDHSQIIQISRLLEAVGSTTGRLGAQRCVSARSSSVSSVASGSSSRRRLGGAARFEGGAPGRHVRPSRAIASGAQAAWRSQIAVAMQQGDASELLMAVQLAEAAGLSAGEVQVARASLREFASTALASALQSADAVQMAEALLVAELSGVGAVQIAEARLRAAERSRDPHTIDQELCAAEAAGVAAGRMQEARDRARNFRMVEVADAASESSRRLSSTTCSTLREASHSSQQASPSCSSIEMSSPKLGTSLTQLEIVSL